MTKIDMPQIYLMNYYKLKSRNQSENEKRKKRVLNIDMLQ